MSQPSKPGTEAAEHAERCLGLPTFEQDSIGQWFAECSRCGFEITGCESRREAGARFYGGELPGLYGTIDGAS